MKLLKILWALVLIATLGACGGGGTPEPDPRNPGTTTSAWALSVVLVDSAGAVLTNNAINSAAPYYARATLTGTNAGSVANRLVSFEVDAAVATLASASALTDANGVASVRISPLSATAANAGRLLVSANISGVAVSATLDYQTAVTNISLANLKPAQGVINAFQSTPVSVEAYVNGVLAVSTPVTVSFSASCGSFSPASIATNGAGLASSVYQASAGCSGVVTLTAQATGAPDASATLGLASALPTSVVFSSASETLLTSTAAPGGAKQSTLKFQVLDSSGLAVSGQKVRLALGTTTAAAGVVFLVGGVASVADQVVTSDTSGFALATVSAGALPTPVVVVASLDVNVAVQASSSGVAVTSGRATQSAASLAASKLSIEAYQVDGVQSTLSWRVADRQGNPVPAGSAVNFVASHGQVQGSCLLDVASQCSVTYTSQGLRPASGRAVILAYMDGEESFIDKNGDNIWQPGETFFDVGVAYRDDDGNGAYDASTEQTYPGGSSGSLPCQGAGAGSGAGSGDGANYTFPSVANTCDGVWSNQIRVRRQSVIALATHEAVISLVGDRTASGFRVQVADLKGNAMPAGTTVAAVIVGTGPVCTLMSTNPSEVRNQVEAGFHDIRLDGAADCASVGVDVTVKTPGGYATTVTF